MYSNKVYFWSSVVSVIITVIVMCTIAALIQAPILICGGGCCDRRPYWLCSIYYCAEDKVQES